MFRGIKSKSSNNRGIALLITLTVIASLVALGLEFNRRMRTLVISAALERDQVTLQAMASSGVHGAMALLVRDKMASSIDSVQEDWANPDKVAVLMSDLPFESGNVSVKISDELSRIQVNALVKPPNGAEYDALQRGLWYRFLSLYDLPTLRTNHMFPVAIVDSIKDWIDSRDNGAISGLNGAESDYYESLEPPYSCPNTFISDISEMIRIKGITPALFYGIPEKPGISEYTTVFGFVDLPGNPVRFSGRININTAEATVLAALLPPEYEDQADRLVNYRLEQSGGNYLRNLSYSDWYKDVPGFDDAYINSRLLTTSSDIFRIESTAVLHEASLTVQAVIRREVNRKSGKYICKILNWKEK